VRPSALAPRHRIGHDSVKSNKDEYRLPPGTQVYDTFNGARVGAIIGALIGAVVTALTSPGLAWSVPVGAVLFGAIGYFTERRRVKQTLAETTPE